MRPLIVILCTGNLCRSPMVATLLRRLLAQRRIAADVLSRGLAAPIGRPPHPFALRTAKHFGVPIAPDKRSGAVNPMELRAAAVILVMDRSHRREVQRRFPYASGKTFLLGHWQGDTEIADPVNAPYATFVEQWAFMQTACAAWLDHLLKAGMLAAKSTLLGTPPIDRLLMPENEH